MIKKQKLTGVTPPPQEPVPVPQEEVSEEAATEEAAAEEVATDEQQQQQQEGDNEEEEQQPVDPLDRMASVPVVTRFRHPSNRMTVRQLVSRVLGFLGFETVSVDSHPDRPGAVTTICRFHGSEQVLFNRLAVILAHDGMEIYKKYVVKEGRLVYGWYFVIDDLVKFQRAVSEALDVFPVRETAAPLGVNGPINPIGRDAISDRNVESGTGAGVIPVRASFRLGGR